MELHGAPRSLAMGPRGAPPVVRVNPWSSFDSTKLRGFGVELHGAPPKIVTSPRVVDARVVSVMLMPMLLVGVISL